MGKNLSSFSRYFPKGLSKITIYLLILSFFVIYQFYLLTHLEIIFAATPIVFSANQSTPASPATFSSTVNKSFSVSIIPTSSPCGGDPIDLSGCAAVVPNGVKFQIGRNITSTYTNLTRCAAGGGVACTWNNSPNVFYINFTPETFDEAGLSNFTWFSNDTSGAGNKTQTVQYTLNKGNPSTALIIQSNVSATITYFTASNLGCSDMNSFDSDLTYTLYRGNSSFSINTAPLNDSAILGAGTYAYNCSTSEGNNWTAGSASNITLVVNQNSTTSNALNLTINSTEGSKQYAYPTATNATGWFGGIVGPGSIPTFTLLRSGTTIGTTNPISDIQTLAAAAYNYTYYTSGNTNYSSASKEYDLTISSISLTIFLNTTKVWWNDSIYASGIASYTNGTADSGDTYTFFINGINQCGGTTNSSGGWSCTFRSPIEINSYQAKISLVAAAISNTTTLYVRPNYGAVLTTSSDVSVFEVPIFIQDLDGTIRPVFIRITTWR